MSQNQLQVPAEKSDSDTHSTQAKNFWSRIQEQSSTEDVQQVGLNNGISRRTSADHGQAIATLPLASIEATRSKMQLKQNDEEDDLEDDDNDFNLGRLPLTEEESKDAERIVTDRLSDVGSGLRQLTYNDKPVRRLTSTRQLGAMNTLREHTKMRTYVMIGHLNPGTQCNEETSQQLKIQIKPSNMHKTHNTAKTPTQEVEKGGTPNEVSNTKTDSATRDDESHHSAIIQLVPQSSYGVDGEGKAQEALPIEQQQSYQVDNLLQDDEQMLNIKEAFIEEALTDAVHDAGSDASEGIDGKRFDVILSKDNKGERRKSQTLSYTSEQAFNLIEVQTEDETSHDWFQNDTSALRQIFSLMKKMKADGHEIDTILVAACQCKLNEEREDGKNIINLKDMIKKDERKRKGLTHDLQTCESFVRQLESRSAKEFQYLEKTLDHVRNYQKQLSKQVDKAEESFPAIFDVLRLTLNIKLRVSDQVEFVEAEPSPGATIKEFYFGDNIQQIPEQEIRRKKKTLIFNLISVNYKEFTEQTRAEYISKSVMNLASCLQNGWSTMPKRRTGLKNSLATIRAPRNLALAASSLDIAELLQGTRQLSNQGECLPEVQESEELSSSQKSLLDLTDHLEVSQIKEKRPSESRNESVTSSALYEALKESKKSAVSVKKASRGDSKRDTGTQTEAETDYQLFHRILELLFQRHSTYLVGFDLNNEKVRVCYGHFLEYQEGLVKYIMSHGIRRQVSESLSSTVDKQDREPAPGGAKARGGVWNGILRQRSLQSNYKSDMSLGDVSERSALTESQFDDDELQPASDSEIERIHEVEEECYESFENSEEVESDSEDEVEENPNDYWQRWLPDRKAANSSKLKKSRKNSSPIDQPQDNEKKAGQSTVGQEPDPEEINKISEHDEAEEFSPAVILDKPSSNNLVLSRSVNKKIQRDHQDPFAIQPVSTGEVEEPNGTRVTSSEYFVATIKSSLQNPSTTQKSVSEETSSPIRTIDHHGRHLETVAKGVEYRPPSPEKIQKLLKDAKKRSYLNVPNLNTTYDSVAKKQRYEGERKGDEEAKQFARHYVQSLRNDRRGTPLKHSNLLALRKGSSGPGDVSEMSGGPVKPNHEDIVNRTAFQTYASPVKKFIQLRQNAAHVSLLDDSEKQKRLIMKRMSGLQQMSASKVPGALLSPFSSTSLQSFTISEHQRAQTTKKTVRPRHLQTMNQSPPGQREFNTDIKAHLRKPSAQQQTQVRQWVIPEVHENLEKSYRTKEKKISNKPPLQIKPQHLMLPRQNTNTSNRPESKRGGSQGKDTTKPGRSRNPRVPPDGGAAAQTAGPLSFSSGVAMIDISQVNRDQKTTKAPSKHIGQVSLTPSNRMAVAARNRLRSSQDSSSQVDAERTPNVNTVYDWTQQLAASKNSQGESRSDESRSRRSSVASMRPADAGHSAGDKTRQGHTVDDGSAGGVKEFDYSDKKFSTMKSTRATAMVKKHSQEKPAVYQQFRKRFFNPGDAPVLLTRERSEKGPKPSGLVVHVKEKKPRARLHPEDKLMQDEAERRRHEFIMKNDEKMRDAVIRFQRDITNKVVDDLELENGVHSLHPSVANLDKDHKITTYVWGHNMFGMLGIPIENNQTSKKESCVMEPTKFHTKLVALKQGYQHSLAIGEKGQLYSWGQNRYGQVGRRRKKAKGTEDGSGAGEGDSAKEHARDKRKHGPKHYQDDFQEMALVGGDLHKVKVRDICCGWDHSMATTQSGLLFTWGLNVYGELGIGTYRDQDKPQHVKDLQTLEVVKMAAGKHHTAVVTKCGKLYTWGHNPDGRLLKTREFYKKNGAARNFFYPQLIKLVNQGKEKLIKDVACGQDHTLALDVDGVVYCGGNAKNGQLGINPGFWSIDAAEQPPYVIVDQFNKDVLPAAKVAAGRDFSMVLTEAGTVYTCGLNTFGRLGLDAENADAKVDKFRPILWFSYNCFTIVDIVAGGRHCIAVSSGNKKVSYHSPEYRQNVFVWGNNYQHQLGQGIGERHDLHEPKMLQINTYGKVAVRCVAAGFATSAVIQTELRKVIFS